MRPLSRGRPQKFGRPARVVALTLPDDVVAWLRGINSDLGWAIVSLFDRSADRTKKHKRTGPPAVAELVELPGRRALIVVDPEFFKGLSSVSTIPLADGRAFLALGHGQGMADLELAIGDRLEGSGLSERRRVALATLKAQFREWRQTPGLTFHSRSIIVAARSRGRQYSGSLASLKGAPGPGSSTRRDRA